MNIEVSGLPDTVPTGLAAHHMFDALAGNPVGALLYLHAAKSPDTPQLPSGLGRAMLDTQRPEERPKVDRALIQSWRGQCATPLKNGRLLSLAPMDGTRSEKFQAALSYRAYAIALAGFVLGWELQHPDLPLSDIVGTGSFSPHRASMPSVVLSILGPLYDAPKGLSQRMLQDRYLVPDPKAYSFYLSKIRTAKLVLKEDRRNHDARNVRLSEPATESRVTSPATRALVAAATRLRQTSHTTVSINELITTALEVADDPAVTEDRLQRRLQDDALPQGISISREGFVDNRAMTHYRLNPKFVPAIADLVLGMRKLQEDPDFRADARRLAETLVGNECPDQIKLLLAKSVRSRHRAKPAPRRGVATAKTKAKAGGASAGITEGRESPDSRALPRTSLEEPPTPGSEGNPPTVPGGEVDPPGDDPLDPNAPPPPLPDPGPYPKNWLDFGACKGKDLDIFFPLPGDTQGITEAKAICAKCSVKAPCAKQAIETKDQDSVSGGLTAEDRNNLTPLQKAAYRAVKISRIPQPKPN